MKNKLLLTSALLASLIASPSYAWNSITILNKTDPVTVYQVYWTAPGTPAVARIVDIRRYGEWRTIGPLPETGPCVRSLFVVVTHPSLGWSVMKAPTPMNVCSEGWITVTGVWPGGGGGVGGTPLAIAHGFGPHPR